MKKWILIILETIASGVFLILSFMFIFASIENIMIQQQVKSYIKSATFEEKVGNVNYYVVDTGSGAHVTKGSYNLGLSGDIFVMPQSHEGNFFTYSFITYLFGGHAGVVINDGQLLVEAMGGGPGEEYVFINDTDLYTEYRTVIGLNVKTTEENKEIACNYAVNLEGKPYNYLFVADTKDKYYCTDLCSRVYSESKVSMPIDENGFVTSSQDLFLSSKTEISFIKIRKNNEVYIYYSK